MAVYTEVTDEALRAFLADYALGGLLAFRGIAEGVENSNYALQTDVGRLHPDALREAGGPGASCPGSSALMEHLAARGIACPLPVKATRRRGAADTGRPAGGDLHLPARRLAAPGAAGALRAARARRWPGCTWPARISPPSGRTRWARQAGRRCWTAAARAATRCSRGWSPSWTRRWPASWRPGRRRARCRSGRSMPTCSPTTSSSWMGRTAAARLRADRLLLRLHRPAGL